MLIECNRLSERAFECHTKRDTVLRGIVTEPAEPSGRGVLLLPAGYKYHVGPHRYNVDLARYLVRSGITVLRADYSGLGASDGALPEGPLYKAWQHVENGGFVEDTCELAAAFKPRYDLEMLAVGGICGAGITGQMAAAALPEVIDRVVEVNPSVTRSLAPGKQRQPIRSEIERSRKDYFRKLLSRDAWKRLLTGASDMRAIKESLFTRVEEDPPEDLLDKVNPVFSSTWKKTEAHGIKKLLFYGERDPAWYEFEDLFLPTALGGSLTGDYYRIEHIPHANHELHLREWQLASFEQINGFLLE